MFAYTTLRREICAVIGLLSYHFYDAVLHLPSKLMPVAAGRQSIGEPELQRVRYFLDEHKKREPASDLFGVAQGRNVIIISAEALQTFPIGLKMHGQLITPRLSAFAKESLYFVNFHDQTHLGTTSDGEFLALQSLHSLPVGAVAGVYATNRYRALPGVLSQHGCTTLAACAATKHFWNMDRMRPALTLTSSRPA